MNLRNFNDLLEALMFILFLSLCFGLFDLSQGVIQ